MVKALKIEIFLLCMIILIGLAVRSRRSLFSSTQQLLFSMLGYTSAAYIFFDMIWTLSDGVSTPVGITAKTSFPARSASITASCPSLKVSYPKWVFKSSCFVINRHDPFCYVPTGTVTLLFFIVESLLFSEYLILTYFPGTCQLIVKNHKVTSVYLPVIMI